MITIILLSGKKSRCHRLIPVIVAFTGVVFFVQQVKSRPLNFNYTGYTEKYELYEIKSKEAQKEILGPNIFQVMNSFDNHIWLNF